MATLRLGKLPDRTPVKLTILISPDLNEALAEYGRAYEHTYGTSEPIAELIPAMLQTFIQGDRAFNRARSTAASDE